jgi:hypothetical protein
VSKAKLASPTLSLMRPLIATDKSERVISSVYGNCGGITMSVLPQSSSATAILHHLREVGLCVHAQVYF